MRKIKKYWPIVVVVYLGIAVVTGVYVYWNFNQTKVLSKGETRSIIERHLDKRYLALCDQYAGFSWKNEKYILVVFKSTDLTNQPNFLCFKVVGNVAVNCPITKVPYRDALYNGPECSQSNITVKDITGDGLPEFIYQRDCCSINGYHCYNCWEVVDVVKKEIFGCQQSIVNDMYPREEILWSKNIEQYPETKEYLLAQISAKKARNQNKTPKYPYQVLKAYWFKNNGMECSVVPEPCKVNLLWVDYPGFQKFFGDWSVHSKDSFGKYKVIAMFKGPIFLIDQEKNKIALIYMPENSYSFCETKFYGNNIILTCGSRIIKYDIETQTLALLP